MTTYDPSPTVTIAGTDFTSETINLITITAGRTSIDDQPRAGYCTVSLIITDGSHPTIPLNGLLRIAVLDSSGLDPHVFTGYVTDVVRRVNASGVLGNTVQIDITAAGPLARLAKLETETEYPKAFDGDRMAAILAGVFTTSWDEVTPATLTWAGTNPALSWQTYDPGYVGTVDQPGDFELYKYEGGAVEALSLTRLVANSALGILYETGDGLLNYDASGSRIDRVGANGFLPISSAYLTGTQIAADSKVADLINSMTISYKANATVSGSDVDSIATYGLFGASRSTYLESATAANQQLSFFLETRATPRDNLAAVNVPLHNPALPDATRDSLIGVFCGLPVTIPDLPNAVYNYPFTGFVEGYQWRITRNTADLTMTVSDYGLTAIQQAWQQVSAAETWNTLQPALTWEDARVVY